MGVNSFHQMPLAVKAIGRTNGTYGTVMTIEEALFVVWLNHWDWNTKSSRSLGKSHSFLDDVPTVGQNSRQTVPALCATDFCDRLATAGAVAAMEMNEWLIG